MNYIMTREEIEQLNEAEPYCFETTREEAEKAVEGMVIECEIYYHKSCGLWATEQGHVESGVVYDPYDGEVCEEPDEDEE